MQVFGERSYMLGARPLCVSSLSQINSWISFVHGFVAGIAPELSYGIPTPSLWTVPMKPNSLRPITAPSDLGRPVRTGDIPALPHSA